MSLGKRVLVLRNVTERVEGLWEGLGKLVGTNETLIYKGLEEFYTNDFQEKSTAVFGDGSAVERITKILKVKLQLAEKKSGRVVVRKEAVCNV